jgi:hypothetical protein
LIREKEEQIIAAEKNWDEHQSHSHWAEGELQSARQNEKEALMLVQKIDSLIAQPDDAVNHWQ